MQVGGSGDGGGGPLLHAALQKPRLLPAVAPALIEPWSPPPGSLQVLSRKERSLLVLLFTSPAFPDRSPGTRPHETAREQGPPRRRMTWHWVSIVLGDKNTSGYLKR